MKKQVGVWIDHKGASYVFVNEDGGSLRHLTSGMEKHVRFSGRATSEEGSADDQIDRQFAEHLNRYYDEVIAHIVDAESILIFGPGEAKGEFAKRLTSKGFGKKVVAIETADKMTDKQIMSKVHQYFSK